MSKQNKRFYEFNDFKIDTVNRRLLRRDEVVPLKAKAVETLLILLEHKGDVVRKDDLMDRLWADSFVEESNLTQNIYTLRKALGEEYIETIPRRGYRFSAEVKEWEDGSSDEMILVQEKTRMSVSYEEETEETPERVGGSALSLTAAKGARNRYLWLGGLSIVFIGLAVFFWLRSSRIPFENAKLAKLTTTGNVWKVAVEPGGKYLAFVSNEPNQQSLWLRQIATGKDLQLTPPAKTQFYGLTFSHDGNYLYYVRREGTDPAMLYRVGTLGGEPLKLVEDVDSPVTLSPDDTQLAFVRFGPQNRAVFVAHADGTQERKLVASVPNDPFIIAPQWEAFPPAWSPDGKTIACIVGIPAPEGKYETLWGFDPESGESRPLTTQRWEEIGRPEWMSDGSGLIVAAAGQGTGFVYQIWLLAYPSGAARKITNDLNDYRDLSLTRDGKTVVAVMAERKSNISVVSTADLDRVKQLTTANFDGINGMVWTTDDRIVYTRLAPGGQNLWIADLEGGEPRQLTSNIGFVIQPAVSPDGRYILYAANNAGKAHIWRIDIDGRNPLELTNGLEDIQPSVTADSQWVIYKTAEAQLFRVSINGGESERLTKGAMPAVSPDGNLLAFIRRPVPNEPTKWMVMPIAGGEPRVVSDLPEINVRFVWTSDGNGLTYSPLQDPASNIWVQPLDGGAPKQLTFWKPERIFSFGWSKDGKKLAFGSGTQTSDVVSIGDFGQ